MYLGAAQAALTVCTEPWWGCSQGWVSHSWSWSRSELADQERAQLAVVQQTTKYLYFHYKQVALIFKLLASSVTTTKLTAHYIFMIVPVEEIRQPLKISNQMNCRWKMLWFRKAVFQKKKKKQLVLSYIAWKTASLKLSITSLSPPCPVFRNNLRPVMNITYKSTSNLGLNLMLSLYPETCHGSLSTSTFLFLLPTHPCFSWWISFVTNPNTLPHCKATDQHLSNTWHWGPGGRTSPVVCR